MHEHGLVQDLITQSVQAARGQQIRQIYVALGELSGVSRDALEFYFEQLQAGTPAAGAALAVRVEPAEVQCADCGARVASAALRIGICPACGCVDLQLLSGDRLVLEALDVA